jgi:phosphocarrier protein
MGEVSISRRVMIANPQGLHARPADLFVRKANQFISRIEVIKDGERVDGKSILGILTLAAEHGSELSIEAVGPDAQMALDALVELVERGFPDNLPKEDDAPKTG